MSEEKIQIYVGDTEQSVKERIAARIQTLPKYLSFTTNINLASDSFPLSQVEDIYAKIKKHSNDIDGSKILELQNLYQGKKFVEDVVKIWIAGNTAVEEILTYGNTFSAFNPISQQLKVSESDLENFWSERESTLKDLQEQIERNKKKSREQTKSLASIRQEVEEIQYTSFFQEDTIYEMTVVTRFSLVELFNLFKATENIPLAKYLEFYKSFGGDIKVYDNFFGDEYAFSVAIVLQIDKYVFSIETSKEGKTTISGHIDIDVNIEKIKMFLQHSFEGVQFLDTREKGITGHFAIKNKQFNNIIFSDLIMNNKIIASNFNIDESGSASKKIESLFLQFNTDEKRYESIGKFSISSRTYGVDVNMKENKELSLNDQYINIIVMKAESMQVINSFKKKFQVAFSIYEKEKNSMALLYKTFFPTFSIAVAKVTKQIKKFGDLKLLFPDLYQGNIARFCQNLPKVVEQEDANSMMFRGRILSCSHHKSHPYTGYRIDRETGICRPCCFIVDQKNKTNYKECVEKGGKVDIEGKKIQARYILKTNKFLEQNQTGILSDKLTTFLQFVTKTTCNRYGVGRSKSSFIDCISIASSKEIRKTLKKREGYFFNVCKQELYDRSDIDIKADILDIEKYVDPKLYFRALEEASGYNIFVFSWQGNFVFPRFAKCFVKNKPKREAILVVEHMGSESDNAKYPQCELIKDTETNSFIFDAKLIQDAFMYALKCFQGDSVIVETPVLDILNIDVQLLDKYGKMRGYITKDKKTEMLKTLYPPLAVRVQYFKPTPTSTFQSFCFNKKLSKYLESFLFFLYKEKRFNEQSIKDFIKANTVVKANHDYKKNFSLTLSFENKTFFDQEKLILDSKELQRKLEYVLEWNLARNMEKVMGIKQVDPIFETTDDFTGTVVYGEKNIKAFLEYKSQLNQQNISEDVVSGSKIIRFLGHNYFATYQNSLKDAESVFKDNEDYSLYKYESILQIELIKSTDKSMQKIIVFSTSEGEEIYVALQHIA